MSTYAVTRSRTIAATPQRVHGLVNDFHNWRQWSPWEGLDADLRRSYQGPESGVGAHYAWEGNRKAGAGEMEIIASTPDAIRIRLQFFKPFKSTSETTFSLAPERAGRTTRVTWLMTGTSTGVFGFLARFMNVDKMVGPDFEKGLDQLARAAERA